jgi:hypothetical protein
MDSTVRNSEPPVDGDDTMVMVNYLGKGCESYHNESKIVKNVADVSVPTQVITANHIHDPINKDYARAMSKPRTALFQEKENDETMAPQVNIPGDLSANNTKYPCFIKLGAFSFDISQNMKKEGNLYSTAILSTRLIFQRVNLHKQYEKQFVQIGLMLCEIKSDIT